MIYLVLTALVNTVIGFLIGWTGIAGFLLPIFYMEILHCSLNSALFLSFSAFAISGIIGACSYYRDGNLNLQTSFPLCIGSSVGAVLGVISHTWIPILWGKTLLYIVVLGSGISILYRVWKAQEIRNREKLYNRKRLIFGVGFLTAAICAISGAGGPILVMPVLTLLGINIRGAIGIALLDSVFIALPSILGYGMQSDFRAILPFLAIGCIFHGAGVWIGGRTCQAIPQKPLKIVIGLFSAVFASYMIVSMWS